MKWGQALHPSQRLSSQQPPILGGLQRSQLVLQATGQRPGCPRTGGPPQEQPLPEVEHWRLDHPCCSRPGPAWELPPRPLTQAALVLLAGRGPPDTQLPLLEAVSHSGPAWLCFQPSPPGPRGAQDGMGSQDSGQGGGGGGLRGLAGLDGSPVGAGQLLALGGRVWVPTPSPEGTRARRSWEQLSLLGTLGPPPPRAEGAWRLELTPSSPSPGVLAWVPESSYNGL